MCHTVRCIFRRVHNAEDDEKSAAVSNNACSVCGERFAGICDLLNHRNSAHDMPTCLLCHKGCSLYDVRK